MMKIAKAQAKPASRYTTKTSTLQSSVVFPNPLERALDSLLVLHIMVEMHNDRVMVVM
jgi:hypothetical protein